jgi:hypothetical protein
VQVIKIEERWIPSIGLGAVVVLLISGTLISMWQQTFFRTDAQGQPVPLNLPNGMSRPGLAMELAATSDDVRGVLCAGARTDEERAQNRRAMQWMQYWDFPFIAAYVTLFLVIARRARLLGFVPLWFLARVALVTALAAGAADVLEDIAILLAVPANGMGALMIGPIGWWKWMLVFVTVFLESSVFLAWSQLPMTGRILALMIGAGSIAVPLLGIQSLLLRCDSFLERSAVWLFGMFFLLALFSIWRFGHWVQRMKE